jgi:hypothetical protein
MAATHYTGVHGTLTIEAGATAISEFSIKIDRGVAAPSRIGEYSDFHAAGLVTVTGTINRMMVSDAFLDYAYGTLGVPAVVDLVGAVTSGSDSITVTANNCIITSGEFKFTDADEIVSDPMTFSMGDPDADLTIALGAPP